MLWGVGVRMLVVDHVTYSTDSVCHVFGSRPFATPDRSGTARWPALLSCRQWWHNDHHAFPTSAAHGMRRWEVDPSAAVIRALERLALVCDVVRIQPDRRRSKVVSERG